MKSEFQRVFGVPILLGILSAVGLLSALFADGFWDALSWVGLGAPLVVIAWFWLRSHRRET
jgi:hypothetical protein